MNETLINNFKLKLKHNRSVLGPFMKTCDPAFVEAAGWSGMDFAILDMEHGPISVESMQNNIRAAQNSGILPIVRVPGLSEEIISKVLDIGAAGIEIPQISTALDARKALEYARFYPKGSRGVCRFVRASHYSALERNLYFETSNHALIIAQLEGQQALANLDEILEVEGIDIIFIGPYDLSQSLGMPGNITHPEVIRQIRLIVDKAKAKGVVTGIFCDTYDSMKMWMKAGVQYLSYSVDIGIFHQACSELVEQFSILDSAASE